MAVKTTNVRLRDGKEYRFAVADGFSNLHRNLFIAAGVVAELDKAIDRYINGKWERRAKIDPQTGGELLDREGAPVFEDVEQTPAKLFIVSPAKASADLAAYQAELFDWFKKMVEESLTLAEVEPPTRNRLIEEVITRADMPLLFGAIFYGLSNVTKESAAAAPAPAVDGAGQTAVVSTPNS